MGFTLKWCVQQILFLLGRVNDLAGTIGGLSTRAGIYSGSGSPDGVVAAQVGSIYTDVDAASASYRVVWTKLSGSGSTGWQ